MSRRLILNGANDTRGACVEISEADIFEAIALWPQILVTLTTGDAFWLKGTLRAQDGYLAVNLTSLWGYKIS